MAAPVTHQRSPSQQNAPTSGPSQNPVAAQLEQVAAKLQKAALPSNVRNDTEQPGNQVEPSKQLHNHTGQPDRAAILAAIKSMEGAIAALTGDEFATYRQELQTQIETKKKALSAAKPMGQRLDDTRSALARSSKRLEQAQEAMKLAQAAVAAAETENATLTHELTQLELEVAANAGGDTSEPEASPLVCLEKQLSAVVAELMSAGNVRQDVVEDAKTQAATLLSRFKATIGLSKSVAREDAGERLRKDGKQPIQSEAVANPADFRIRGKQRPKRMITDFFGPMQKGRIPEGPY